MARGICWLTVSQRGYYRGGCSKVSRNPHQRPLRQFLARNKTVPCCQPQCADKLPQSASWSLTRVIAKSARAANQCST